MKGTKGLFWLGMVALALAFMVLAGCDNGSTNEEEKAKQSDYYGTWKHGDATAEISKDAIKFSITDSNKTVTCNYNISGWTDEGGGRYFTINVSGATPGGDTSVTIPTKMKDKTEFLLNLEQGKLIILAYIKPNFYESIYIPDLQWQK